MIEIEIGRGRVRSGVVKIDEASLPRVLARKWYIDAGGYAFTSVRRGGKRTIPMHRILLDVPEGMHVDHKNGDVLDNRLENLRVCTHAENMRNRRPRRDNKSGLKGATFVRSSGRWMAQIGFNGKNKYLGMFATSEEAHAAYRLAAVALHGEFARVA